jgi:YfiR/HmsC-like
MCTAGEVWASGAGIRLGLLFNFIKFTEWPAGTFSQPTSPLTICLAAGDDDMADGLPALEQRTVQGHPVRTALITRPNQVGACQVLYLPAAGPGRISGFVDAAGNGRVLTVSDHPDFIDGGGMIGLILDDNRYVFEINNEALKQAELRMNPQVLKLARKVR